MKSCRELLIHCRKALLISLAVNLVLLIALIISLVIPSNAESITPVTSEITPEVTTQVTCAPTITPCVSETTAEPECLGVFKITAYCPCVKCCGIWSAEHPSRVGTGYIQTTASGTIPKAGHTVAADISVLPFGTVIIIDGHEYTVEDRGGAVDGNTIDIFFETHQEALNWGKQYKNIYIKGDK